MLKLSDENGRPLLTSKLAPATSHTPFILHHLLSTITVSSSDLGYSIAGRKQHPKLLESALDLLAAIVKGQPTLSAMNDPGVREVFGKN